MKNIMYECRKCQKLVSFENYNTNIFCPACGTHLQLQPPQKHWLFQFNPSTYRWFDRIKDTNEPEQWLTSQYAKLISKGDLVAIRSSGQKSGIYALGQIITNPAKKPLNPSQEPYFIEKKNISKFQEKYSVTVLYSKVALDKPILQDECNRDAILLHMQVFMKPQGTNFRLTTEQWNRIIELMA